MGGPQPTGVWNGESEAGEAVPLPSLGALRRTGGEARHSNVLDRVLYGQFDDDRSPVPARDVRRDIVDTAVLVVRAAANREPRILAGPSNPHSADRTGGDWPQRFGHMLNRVLPVDNGASVTADLVAQCAEVPIALAKLVAIMSTTVTDRLIADGRSRDQLFRNHMRNAARFADIAWCASHGELSHCPSWRIARRDQSEQQVLAELRRHLPADAGSVAGEAVDTPAVDADAFGGPPSAPRTSDVAAATGDDDPAMPESESEPGFDDATDLHWATVLRDIPDAETKEPGRSAESAVEDGPSAAPGDDSSTTGTDYLGVQANYAAKPGDASGADIPSAGARRGQSVPVPGQIIDLLAGLLADGRWPSAKQRTIAARLSNLLGREPEQ